MLVFGLWGGVIADRYSEAAPPHRHASRPRPCLAAHPRRAHPHRRRSQVWHVYVISFVLGLVTVIDNPARQVFVNELVGPHYLRNAISLNSSIFQLGGLIGPAVGGILITAVGGGWSFAINAVACLAVVGGALLPQALASCTPAPRRRAARDSSPRASATCAASRSSSGPSSWSRSSRSSPSTCPCSSPPTRTTSSTSARRATGSSTRSSRPARWPVRSPPPAARASGCRMVVGTAAALGVVQAIAGFAPNEIAFGVLLVGIGVGNLLFITGANSLVQMSSNVQIRGRVISLYILVLLGGQAIGGPLMGWVVEQVGPHIAMMISGVVPALAAVVVAVLIARTASLRLRFGLRGPATGHRHREPGREERARRSDTGRGVSWRPRALRYRGSAAPVAQRIEQEPSNLLVAGSIPAGGTRASRLTRFAVRGPWRPRPAPAAGSGRLRPGTPRRRTRSPR